MKKVLVILGILTLICVNVAFADTPVTTVYGTETNALNWADFSLGNKFTAVMQEVVDYVNTETIGNFDKTTNTCILFPNQVLAWDNITEDYYIIFYFGYTTSNYNNYNYGVVTHNPTDTHWWTEATGPFNYCVGAESYLIGGHAYWVTYHNGTITHTNYTVSGSLDVSALWSITCTLNDGGKYLVANTKAGFNNKYGLAGSIYFNSPGTNITSLDCYNGYYHGWDTTNWSEEYTLNTEQSITPANYSFVESNTYVQTDVIVSGDKIIFDNSNNANDLDFDINTLDIWSTLRYYILNLLSGFQSVIYLFTTIFGWLPVEFTTLIYGALILAITLLIIKVLRGG